MLNFSKEARKQAEQDKKPHLVLRKSKNKTF
jgi:hypothetical protein